MFQFVVKRLFTLIPLLLAVTFIASILMYVSPGDVLTKMRANPEIPPETIAALEADYSLVDEHGEPTKWFVRYGAWLKQLLKGNLGNSLTYQIPVTELIGQRIVATFLLSLTSVLFAWAIAVPLGVMAAIKKDSIFDRLSALLAYSALSIPEFFLAIIAVYVAAITGWFPIGGRSSIGSEYMGIFAQFWDYAYHLILPTIVLGIGSVASMMRIMRANFIDEMRQDYVNTARAKGMPESFTMFKHVLRNAINPLISAMGFAFASLLSGALLVESIMNYPGLGQLIYQALLEEDEYVVMAALMLSTTMLVLGNSLADILLAGTDPRIRSAGIGEKTHLSPIKVLIVTGVFFAIIGVEIVLELFVPSLLGYIGTALKWISIAFIVLLATLCLGLVGYTVVVLTRRLLKPLLKRPIGAAAFGLLATFYFLAFFADFIAPYSLKEQNLKNSFHPPTMILPTLRGLEVQDYKLTDPQTRHFDPIKDECNPIDWLPKSEPYKLAGFIPMEHKLFGVQSDDPNDQVFLLGADAFGRDVFSRLLYGAQISLTIGLVGISITLTLGFLIGGLAGYFGGVFDFIAMRIVELLMSIPTLYLLLALRSALFEPGLSSTQVYLALIIILSVIGWAGAARIIRGMALSLRKRSYVMAARSMGQSHFNILIKHFLPNIASYLLVAATLSIPGYILGEAALSFLGLGIMEPSASWGLMLKQAQGDMQVFFHGMWWLLTPGIAIFLTVVAFNVLGDELRDIVDPRSQSKSR